MTRETIFLTKSKEKYKDKYDYSKFIFKNAKTKSIIICPIHGEFLQHPELHLSSVYGCPECSKIGRGNTRKGMTIDKSSKYNVNEMYILLKEKYPEYDFDLSNYKGLTDNKITLICETHGETRSLPNNILKSTSGCFECSRLTALSKMTYTYKDAEIKFNNIHNNKYKYYSSKNSLTYTNLKDSIIKINCPIHGDFEKLGYRHMKGHGCFECVVDYNIKNNNWPGGYNEKIFKRSENLKNKDAFIYYLKIGKYYKIGITINMEQRLIALKSKSKLKIKKIFIEPMKLYDAYCLEQKLLKKYSNFRQKTFWSSELFIENVVHESELI